MNIIHIYILKHTYTFMNLSVVIPWRSDLSVRTTIDTTGRQNYPIATRRQGNCFGQIPGTSP